ncbi:MAG: methane monooxygenase/ammonia monooxygenase subunit C [Methylocystis sp.]
MSIENIATEAGAATAAQKPMNLKTLWIGLGVVLGFAALTRIYEQLFGWSQGLDSFAPEFQLYWRNPLIVAVFASVFGFVGVCGYLWRSRDRDLKDITPIEETRRYYVLVQWLVVFAIALYVGLSFFTEQTAVWHMTAVRDSDFTPSNIVTFYMSYPLFAVIGFGAYVYAMTRLPSFSKGASLPFGIFVVGTFMVIPNIGFNEWGHTGFWMDEGFASPLHWGFAFFGWMSLGCFGVTLQILGRMRELLGEEGVKAITRKR